MRKRRWTEKQIKEKIKSIKDEINYKKRTIKRTEEEIEDLVILLGVFQEKLSKKYNNPSSVKFGAKVEGKNNV